MNGNRASGGLHVLDLVAIGAAALIVVLETRLWLWAGAAGVLFGSGWPRLTPGALPHTIAGVAAHLSDPRQGFPARLRPELPGPTGFYLTLVLLAVVLGLSAAAAIKLRQRARVSGLGDPKRHGARWARAGDLGRLYRTRRGRHVTAPPDASRRTSARATGHGLSLGHRGARLLRAEDRHALVVFGPTQSGKSAGIAIPNILEWEGPAIVVSIKPDLLDATLTARAQRGKVLVFDPLGQWKQPSHTWSPLASSSSWNGALQTGQRMASAGETDTSTVKGGSFWSQAAEQRLAPLLYAAARTRRGMGEVVRWVYGQGGAELDRIMHDLVEDSRGPLERADAQQAHDAHLAFCRLAGETRGSIEGTAQILLSAYRSPTVVRSADGADITGRQLLEGRNTVYVISDSRRSRLLRPILIALLTELLDHAYDTANNSPGRRLPNPLLVCLDELGNAVPLPNLAEIASTAASHNIQLISIFHDIAQARTRYRDQSLTVINNHRARMLLSGVADMETLRYFSELVGEEEVKDRSDPGASIRRRPLAPADQLRQIKPRARPAHLRQPAPRDVASAPVLQRPQAEAGRMTAQILEASSAHAELLMTADVAVAGCRSLREPEQRWDWFQKLYEQAAHLDRRYRLALRSGWWEDEIQVELLATLGAWVGMFDYANWADPEAKARLLLQLQSVRELVRGGAQQFDPERDRETFERHLRAERECEAPNHVP